MLQERRLFGTISPGILDNEVSILFKDKNDRLYGTPGDVNFDGYKETHIGSDGRAAQEIHHTDHNNPKRHTNPHIHKITWVNDHPKYSGPINIIQ